MESGDQPSVAAPPVFAPVVGNEAPVSAAADPSDQERTLRDQAAREAAQKLALAQVERVQREAERLLESQRLAAHQEAQRQQALQDASALLAEQEAQEAQDAARREQDAALQRERADKQAQLEAKQLEARQEQARQEQARQDQERQDQERQEQARQEQARQEQARQEQVRQEQARQEQARQEQARQEQARQEQARQEQARQDQAQQERAGQASAREERLRAIGRQLNEEAAARDRASRPQDAPESTTAGLRRGWMFGRADPNAELVAYAQAMGRKIELNMTFDMLRELIKQPHTQPVVTIAVRADGSVERVTFVTSSGVPALDEAIRNVIASQAPFGVFPPALAHQYDVVEIRRAWKFDTAIRLE